MLPRLVPEILSKCAFCDEVGAGGAVGIGDSRSLMEFCCQRLGATAAILLTKLESSKSDLLAKVVEPTSEIYRYAEVLSKQKNLD